MRIRALLAIAIGVVSAPGVTAGVPHYAAGQVWAYKTRPGEEMSRVLIDNVEEDPKLGRIYHITVTGVHIGKATAPTGFVGELSHLPVSEKTLTLSCTTLVGQSAPSQNYVQGYRVWREAFEAGRAGVYTISVAEIVSITDQTLQKQQ